MAVLGADVTVFDISESNARYASELFTAANVEVDYVLGDFQSTAYAYKEEFEAVVMELGIIHYFANITEFVAAIHHIVPIEGLVIFNDFHPIMEKSMSVHEGEVSLTGDYFFSESKSAQTPYEKCTENDIPTCLIRQWTLGEIVTAFASGGFCIRRLIEYPSSKHVHLPGTSTLVATSASVTKQF